MIDYIKIILEKSVKKHGEKPLTNKYLLNIINMAEKQKERNDYYFDMIGNDPNE